MCDCAHVLASAVSPWIPTSAQGSNVDRGCLAGEVNATWLRPNIRSVIPLWAAERPVDGIAPSLRIQKANDGVELAPHAHRHRDVRVDLRDHVRRLMASLGHLDDHPVEVMANVEAGQVGLTAR